MAAVKYGTLTLDSEIYTRTRSKIHKSLLPNMPESIVKAYDYLSNLNDEVRQIYITSYQERVHNTIFEYVTIKVAVGMNYSLMYEFCKELKAKFGLYYMDTLNACKIGLIHRKLTISMDMVININQK